jgi:hypothetical protein
LNECFTDEGRFSVSDGGSATGSSNEISYALFIWAHSHRSHYYDSAYSSVSQHVAKYISDFIFIKFVLLVGYAHNYVIFQMWTQRMQRPIRLKIGRRYEEYAAIIKYLIDYFNRMSLLSTSIHYTAARLMNSSFVSYCSLYDRGVILIVII